MSTNKLIKRLNAENLEVDGFRFREPWRCYACGEDKTATDLSVDVPQGILPNDPLKLVRDTIEFMGPVLTVRAWCLSCASALLQQK